ncbi:hypothetical protein [Actinophytocola sp.]|uniref:hypothetical protein n=1 Tax=Actinophytocola sp. TaxID=1872138 RepID=UPI002D7FA81A|nr:hypothetical protein [Actinophytocola sp.]HET9144280.1 hypothetical protein [Actinophytocola sp.]HEU5107248.1 hypothetical protein [Micromonosporaceae bacterium]
MIWEHEPEREEGRPVEAETNRSAQDWFRLMIDMGLAPGLRTLGFLGAGRRYRMDVEGRRAEVYIVQSQSLIDSRIRFTLALRVPSKDEWAAQLRVRPYHSARPSADPTGWEATIGQLVTVGGYPIEDLWWELEVGHPFESLAREVLGTLTTYGLPALRHHIRANS